LPPSPPPNPTGETAERLNEQLKELRLPTFREQFQPLADQAVREGLSYPQYLAELASRECQSRNHSRVQRLLRNSHLLQGKTWDQFQWSRVPLQVARQLQS
jgi:DNA replication protein DnaC